MLGDDERFSKLLANVLRIGVIIASTVVILGGIIFLHHHGRGAPELQVFHGEPSFLRTAPGILQADKALRGRAIIQLGILLLILTPVARVAFCFLTFARQGERLYMVLTLVVLAVLLHSFAVAL